MLKYIIKIIIFIHCMVSIFTYAEPVKLLFVTENLPPFQMQGKNKVTGFATEIIEAMLNETPYDYQIDLYPWSRSYNFAQQKENSCIYSIARTKDRENLFQWTKPIATSTSSFIGLASRYDIEINSIEDAKRYNSVVIRDDVAHHFLLKNGFEELKNLYVVNNSDSLLKLLLTRNNIDFILIDYLTVPYRAKVNKLNANLFKSFYKINSNKLEFYVACSNKTDIVIIKTLSKAIDTIRDKGIYREIINKWSITHRGLVDESD